MLKNFKNLFVAFYCIFSVVHITEASTINESDASKTIFEMPNKKMAVVVDGIIDEEVWRHALRIELNVETSPGENIAAPVKTVAYMFEDGENLYVAMQAFDPEPSKIRAHYHDHDYIFDDDIVGFKIDTYNDALRSYQFFVNALGVKHDSIEDDVIHQDDLSWNAIWDAASTITNQGFQAEFSIPLRILRFDDSKVEQKWGFDLLRFYPREVTHRISHHRVDRNISCNLCQNASFTGLRDIKMGENISIVPFMTATKNQQRMNPKEDQWQTSDTETDFGADFRWGISADTTLNATLNPDFSQVESDVAQLDINNTFSLFFPEKRPFFIEGSDYYTSLMNLVYTRNISDPEYGVKVTHSSEGNNLAAFFSNDTRLTYILPGNLASNIVSYDDESINGVIRYRHDLANTSSLGAMVTLRKADDYHNYVYGFDGVFRLSDTDVLRAQLLQSESEDAPQIVESFALSDNTNSGTGIDVHYKHQDRDWTYWGQYTRLANGFRADLGFQPRNNYQQLTTGIRRYWFNKNDHWWNKLSVGFDSKNLTDLNNDNLQSWLRGTVYYAGPAQSEIELNVATGEQYWKNQFYDIREINLSTKLTPIPGLVLNFAAIKQKTIDFSNAQSGDLLTISPHVTMNLGQHFQAEIRFTRLKMDVSAGNLFKSDLVDARLIYQFSAHSFLRLVIQHNKTQRQQHLYSFNVDANYQDLGTQLLYSYKLNQQTVFFLGYSDTAYEDDNFNNLQKTGKTLFMKMSYSWLY